MVGQIMPPDPRTHEPVGPAATARLLMGRDFEQVARAVVEIAASMPGISRARFCPGRASEPIQYTAVSDSAGNQPRRRRNWISRAGGATKLERNVIDTHGGVVGTLSVEVAAPGDHAAEADSAASLDSLALYAGHALERLALGERLDRTAARLAAEQARARRLDAAWTVGFDEAPIGMAVLRLAPPSVGELVRVNDATCRITGLSVGQLTSSSLNDLVHHVDRGRFTSALARAMDGGRNSFTLVLRLLSPPGRGEELYTPSDRGDGILVRLTTTTVPEEHDAPSFAISHIEVLSRQSPETEESFAERGLQTRMLTNVEFRDQLERTLTRAARSASSTGVLLCDLKLLDQRSATLSDERAAALSAELHRQLEEVLHPDDAVGLLEPTALGVVLTDLSADDAEARAEGVHAAITRAVTIILPCDTGVVFTDLQSCPRAPKRPAELAIALIDPLPRPRASTETVLADTLHLLRDRNPSQPARSFSRPEGTGTKIVLWRRADSAAEGTGAATRTTLWQRPRP